MPPDRSDENTVASVAARASCYVSGEEEHSDVEY